MHRNHFWYSLIFLFLHHFGVAQLVSPDVNCTQVDASGNTTILWTAASDPSNIFVAYHVFVSINGGTYLEVGQVNGVTATSYVDLSNNANVLELCYQVAVEYDLGAGPVLASPGTPLCNVSLSIAPSASPVGQVEISWTGAPALNGYILMWDDPFTNWSNSVALSSNQNSYSIEVTTCGDLLSFLVFSNQQFCPSISPIVEDVFFDQTPPAVPSIQSVTVNNGHPQVNWTPSTSPDTHGYILYQCFGTNRVIVDTIFGGQSSSYIDNGIVSANETACYTVCAFDDCPSGNPPSPNTSAAGADCNCSILLSPLSQTPCSSDIAMSWTPYSGWSDGVAFYIIYHAEGNGNFTAIDTISNGTFNFTHALDDFTQLNHSYYVLALSNNGNFSISNVRTITLNYPTPPPYQFISHVDTELDKTVSVFVNVPVTTDPHRVVLQRYDDYFEEWVDAAEQMNSLNPLVFSISGLLPQYFVYQFRAVVVNQCNDTVGFTNRSNNILLEGLLNEQGNGHLLKWNNYKNWPSGIFQYEIYRAGSNTRNYDSLPPLVFRDTLNQFYYDHVDSLFQEDGVNYYRVRAIGFDGDLSLDTTYKSWSNEITMMQSPLIFVPSAMLINGVNNTFGPVISFSPRSRYEMYVYSKWGDVLFYSDDYDVQWDGRDEGGDFVPQGVYVYYVQYANGTQELLSKRGLVTVLYAE